jgi:hypothetical protein
MLQVTHQLVGRLDAVGRQLVEAGALQGHQPGELAGDRRAGLAPFADRDRHVEPAAGRPPVGGAGPAPDFLGELVVVEGHPLHLAGRGAHPQQHLEAQAIAGLEEKSVARPAITRS